MFKVGDKVEVCGNHTYSITKTGSIGTIYKLNSIYKGAVCVTFNYIPGLINLFDSNFDIFTIHLKLHNPKLKPISETDFLDAFKENFKDGV